MTPNENYYVFDLGQPKIQWFRLAASNDIGKTASPTSSNTESSSNLLIICLSTGLAVIVLVIIVVASVLLYRRRMKKRQNNVSGRGEIGNSDVHGVLQIPSDADADKIPAY